MARSPRTKEGMRRAIACSEWLFRLLLCVYPTSFRRVYGLRMMRVFRDSCRDVLQQRDLKGLALLWLQTLYDLIINAYLERWYVLKGAVHTMTSGRDIRTTPIRLWLVLTVTLIAFVVSEISSLNLYLLEDASPLTQVAYSVSPLLRFSYDGIYLSSLAAGVAVCAIAGYTIVQRALFVMVGLIIVALLIAFGGFGGLLFRHPETFLLFFVVFVVLTLISFLCGLAVATRFGRVLGQRRAAILGACMSTGCVLLINVVALVLHTLILNPVSHALYMQGQIGATPWNFSLIAMLVALLTVIVCFVSLGRALRLLSHQS
jgi:hypothetical protein